MRAWIYAVFLLSGFAALLYQIVWQRALYAGSVRRAFPTLRHIFADRVYRGEKLRNAIADCGKWTIEIVTRSHSIGTFKAEPRRWMVERTFAWLTAIADTVRTTSGILSRAKP